MNNNTIGDKPIHSVVARNAAEARSAIPFALEQFSKLPSDAHVDIKVVAGLIGGGVSTIWAKLKRNDPLIPKPPKFGRSTRFNVGELRAALAAHVAGSTP